MRAMSWGVAAVAWLAVVLPGLAAKTPEYQQHQKVVASSRAEQRDRAEASAFAMRREAAISKAQTTNLAVVAPGIAEALLATAFGLAAAIPAVVIYNVFARSIAGYRALLGDAAAEILRLVSRDLERPAAAAPSARRSTPLSAAE